MVGSGCQVSKSYGNFWPEVPTSTVIYNLKLIFWSHLLWLASDPSQATHSWVCLWVCVPSRTYGWLWQYLPTGVTSNSTHPPTVSRLKTNSALQMKAILSAQNEKVVAFGLISPKMFVFNGEKVDSVITIHLERARCCDLLSSALKSPPISSHS